MFSLPDPSSDRPMTYSGTFPPDLPPMTLEMWQIAMAWCESVWAWLGIPANADPNQPRCGWWGETRYQLPSVWRGWANE